MQLAGKIVAISIQYFKLTWQLVQPANSQKEEGYRCWDSYMVFFKKFYNLHI
jgi:hypothetical protein